MHGSSRFRTEKDVGGQGVFVLTLVAQRTRIECPLNSEDAPDANGRGKEGIEVTFERCSDGQEGRLQNELDSEYVDCSMNSCVRSGSSSEADLAWVASVVLAHSASGYKSLEYFSLNCIHSRITDRKCQ